MEGLKEENERLKQRIAVLEGKLLDPLTLAEPFEPIEALTIEEIERFGRQLVIPNFGIQNQLKIRNKSFLLVGAGGLGSPCTLYLGAGGVGRLGIVDHDVVETNNLHRQVIHTEARQGTNKAISATMAIKAIYPKADVVPYPFSLDKSNALDLIKQYDIIIDATDNIVTRYLLSDAAVLAGKPVISGSALRNDGQLTIFNYNNGPCYRCLHPVPPPSTTVLKCFDNGVLGVVPGIIGTLQALEAMKVAMDTPSLKEPSFLILSTMSNPMIRTMRMRGKQKDCAICGENPTIRELVDYEQFCNNQPKKKISLDEDQRIEVEEYNALKNTMHLLIDVRQRVQYEICHLPGSVSIPLDQLANRFDETQKIIPDNKQVYVICRIGNDSPYAIQILQDQGIMAREISGGLLRWSKNVDPSFPIY